MPRIFYILSGGCGNPYYRVTISSPGEGDSEVTLGKDDVSEDALRDVLSRPVALSCYRAPDKVGHGCTHSVATLELGGRNILRVRN